MKLEVIPNAGVVALKSWSLWANRIGLVALILAGTWADANPYVFGWLGIAIGAAVELLRYLSQGGLDGDRTTFYTRPWTLALALAAVLALAGMGRVPVQDVVRAPTPEPVAASGAPTYEQTAAVLIPLLAKWEGKHACPDAPDLHCSYLDTIASPPLWTVAYGHTETAHEGQRMTEGEARALLARDAQVYWQGVRRGFTAETVAERLTAARDAALASLGYNVGAAAVRKSTATKRLNAGDIAGACEALTWWNRAGQRIVRGLVRRRTDEKRLCLQGLAA